MIITPDTMIPVGDKFVSAAKCKVYDCVGNVIPYAVSYDTETKEVEILVKIQPKQTVDGEAPKYVFGEFIFAEVIQGGPLVSREIARFRAVLPGSYIEVDGRRFEG